MWNNLRDDGKETPFFEDDMPEVVEQPAPKKKMPSINLGRYFEEPILGMTAPQRFLLSVLVLIAVCMLGTMFLVITGNFSFF